MSKIDLSNDYDPDALDAQKQFINDLGPYSALVTTDDRLAFNHRLQNYWFGCWPLKQKNYIDADHVLFRKGQISKKVNLLLMWSTASAVVTEVHKERGWRGYFEICEVRHCIRYLQQIDLLKGERYASSDDFWSGDIAEANISYDIACVSTERPRPRPRPRPIAKKQRIDIGETAEPEIKAAEEPTI